MNYTHLSQSERYQIYALIKAGQPLSDIAKILRRHRYTIYREVTRNSGLKGYLPRQTEELNRSRSAGSHNGPKITPEIRASVDELLRQQLSPEEISAKLEVSHETIYQHICADRSLGGDLCRHLRCQKKRRKRYAGGRERGGQIIGRRPISERPAHIESRLRLWHWEGDTLIAKDTSKPLSAWSNAKAVTLSYARRRTKPRKLLVRPSSTAYVRSRIKFRR